MSAFCNATPLFAGRAGKSERLRLRVWFRGGSNSASDPLDNLGGRWRLKRLAVNDPRPVVQRMLAQNLSAFDGEAQCSRADAKHRSRFLEIQPSLLKTVFLRVTGDFVPLPQRDDPFSRPAISASRT